VYGLKTYTTLIDESVKNNIILHTIKHLTVTQRKGRRIKKYSKYNDEIILPYLADRFLSIGWVSMS
jgi:hypothetical protein